MAVPPRQQNRRAVIRMVQDGNVHHPDFLEPLIAAELGVSDEDRLVRINSGTEDLFHNRIRSSLKEFADKGPMDRPKPGYYQINDRGRHELPQLG